MTRNEWIADRAAFSYDHNGASVSASIKGAIALAEALEAANVAPWQPAPAKDEGEAIGLVRRYVARIDEAGRRDDSLYGDMCAYLSRLDGKGGAK